MFMGAEHSADGSHVDEQTTWNAREKAAISGLAPLTFLVGEWRGRGQSQGAPITGTLVVRSTMGGSWIEARETQTNAQGVIDHTDLSLYRYDTEEHRLEVVHIMEPAHMARHPVESVDGAFHWITGPISPRIVFRATDTGLHFAIWFPAEEAAAVTMDYTPA
jgi:hypothetical protein